MIIPGVQIGNIKINDPHSSLINPVLIEKLTLNQKLYQCNEFKVRTNENDNINLIHIKSGTEDYESIIKIGNQFKDVNTCYNLLYDDDEFAFYIEGIDGMCFYFEDAMLSHPEILNKKITSISVYDISMDENKHLWVEKVPKTII